MADLILRPVSRHPATGKPRYVTGSEDAIRVKHPVRHVPDGPARDLGGMSCQRVKADGLDERQLAVTLGDDAIDGHGGLDVAPNRRYVQFKGKPRDYVRRIRAADAAALALLDEQLAEANARVRALRDARHDLCDSAWRAGDRVSVMELSERIQR